MLKNHQKELMDSINNFLDNILNINNLFKKLLESYFKKNFDEVENITNQISDLESQCDKIRRDVERKDISGNTHTRYAWRCFRNVGKFR